MTHYEVTELYTDIVPESCFQSAILDDNLLFTPVPFSLCRS